MALGRGSSLHRGGDRVVGGVCAGLAEYFQIDPLFVRLAFVALTFIGGAGIILYLILWILMPAPGVIGVDGRTVARDNVRGMASEFRQMGEEFRRMGDEFRHAFRPGGEGPPPSAGPEPAPQAAGEAPPAGEPAPAVPPHIAHRRGIWVGTILVVVGGFLLIQNLGLVRWWEWSIIWPLLLIGIGVLILAQRLR